MFSWGQKEVEALNYEIDQVVENLKTQNQINADYMEMIKILAERLEHLDRRVRLLEKQAGINATVF